MNEQNPEVPQSESTNSLAPYKDRSTGLVIFGILTILLGCVVGLFIPLMLLGQAMAAKGGGSPTSFLAILPAILIYGLLSVALVWLGIGSILARRWARALLVIFSWSWLVMGVITLIFMTFIMPKIMATATANASPGHSAMPEGTMAFMMIVMAVIFGTVFAVLPAIWTFFYNSSHVKATCERRDPATRWTDACPLPVLGLCLWLALCAPMLLITPIAGHGVIPFFGMFLTGVPGGIFCVAVAFVWGYAAWSLYKLQPQGWWIIFVAMCLLMASTFLTFSRHDIIEMYRLMHYPEAQIEQIQKSGLLVGNQLTWMTAFWMLPFLGYLFFVRKFIFRKSSAISP